MKIAVNTGGGDAPGLNAVIRGIALAAYQKGWEVFGIKYGYRGLVDTRQIIRLTPESVCDITNIDSNLKRWRCENNIARYRIVIRTDIIEFHC